MTVPHLPQYDNSGAFTNEDSLADVIDLFPREKVTRIDWPCKICSNRDGNEGERSSQYAAESSCRLRFGSHAKWLGSFGEIRSLFCCHSFVRSLLMIALLFYLTQRYGRILNPHGTIYKYS